MALATIQVQLSAGDVTILTAAVTTGVFIRFSNGIGEKAFIFVLARGGTVAATTTVLFTNGLVFPAALRALGQSDLTFLIMNPGDSLHGITELGYSVATVTTFSIG